MRNALCLVALTVLAAALPATVLAGPEPAPARPAATLASDADAQAAVAKFEEDWKAKGLKGDDRLSQRDYAMAELSKLQHRLVVEALAGASKDPDPMLRTMAVVYLAEQTLLPGPAGVRVQAALKRHPGDEVFVMSCLQSLGKLKFLGAKEEIKSLLENRSFALKKAAILAVGATGDLRLMKDMLEIVGVDLPMPGDAAKEGGDIKESSGKETVVEEGYSWEGAEATVDWGMSDNSAENAEAKKRAEAQIAKNKAEAQKNAQGSGGGARTGGGEGGGGPGRGGTARDISELLPYVIASIKRITGENFAGPGAFKKWYRKNLSELQVKMRELDAKEKAQEAAAAKK